MSLRPSKGLTECRRCDHFCGSNTIQYVNYAEILKPELENYLSPGFREYQTEAFQAVVGTLQKAGQKWSVINDGLNLSSIIPRRC